MVNLSNKDDFLPYNESKKYQRSMRIAALKILVKLIKKYAGITTVYDRGHSMFGYEIEGHAIQQVSKDDQKPDYQLDFDNKDHITDILMPMYDTQDEVCRWVTEITPADTIKEYLDGSGLWKSLKDLCYILHNHNKPGKHYLMAAFPPKLATMSYPKFIDASISSVDDLENVNMLSKSIMMHDDMTAQNTISQGAACNMRLRRQEKPSMDAEIYQDVHTNMVDVQPGDRLPGTVYLDALCVAFGNISLQTTFGNATLDEARWVYDQYCALSPLWLAFSASVPMIKGTLLNGDTCWDIYSTIIDDRSPAERKAAKNAVSAMWSNCPKFVSTDARNLKRYDDAEGPAINRNARRVLRRELAKEGIKIDKKLLDHFATIFNKEHISFSEEIGKSPELAPDSSLFEIIQGTVCYGMRLKPPPSLDSDIGWRTELRTMDAQLTLEMTFLLCHSTQVMNRLFVAMRDQVNFYMPMSLVHENFKRANKVNACVKEKFFQRTNIFDSGIAKVEELTMLEILNGTDTFIGLRKLVDKFLDQVKSKIQEESGEKSNTSVLQAKATFEFLSELASGKIPTTATLIRTLVKNHKLYKQDSKMSEELLDDLTQTLIDIQKGKNTLLSSQLSKFIVCE